jgi:hypothetical protein
LSPDAGPKPVVALVVELSHRYVNVPDAPVGIAPYKVSGAVPEQIVCGAEVITLFAMFGFTDTPTSLEVSLHVPDITIRLNHVVTETAPGL